MRKGAMSYIMKEDGDAQAFGFFGFYWYAFGSQYPYSLPHQVHCAKGMLKTGMVSRRVNIIGQPKLFDPAEALEPGMIHDIVHQFRRDGDEPVNRVVYGFYLIDCPEIH